MEGTSGAGGASEVVRPVSTDPATSWRDSVSPEVRRGVCHHLVSKKTHGLVPVTWNFYPLARVWYTLTATGGWVKPPVGDFQR